MKYILTLKKTGSKILFEFSSNGILKGFKIDEGDASEKMVRWLLGYLPLHEKALRDNQVFKTYFKIEQVRPDLSFKAFWESYDYKVGNKKRAERLWLALTEPEKAQAMAAVSKYKRWLGTKAQDMAYAETWLKQRRFENTFQ